MQLTIQNVAKISHAAIDFNGITVIAGENNTGKSTVGKVLYCIFTSFYESENKINQEKKNLIGSDISKALYPKNIGYGYPSSLFDDFLKIDIKNKNHENLLNLLLKVSSLNNSSLEEILSKEEMNILCNNIFETLSVQNDYILKEIITKVFRSEFNSQTNHVNFKNKAQINLKIKKDSLELVLSDNKCINFKNTISFFNDSIYIDNPFSIDEFEFQGSISGKPVSMYNHKSQLHLKFSLDSDSIEDIIVKGRNESKLAPIIEKMNLAISGDFSKINNNRIVFKENNLSEPLYLPNLSTGMKTFAIIKRLIENGSIRDKGILILDEPEIHLHPEWQLIFAEILVLLQKTFNLNILINTHSPYFLNAIEVFSLKYNVDDKCKYYLAELEENGISATIRDVSDDTELIYEKLAAPLQKLEDIEWGADS
ncbi:AAA family ATPase [Methanolapillus ohkumae]|uniref:Endonuclease GajA/Old nuclease/RecF-like AAA domain-containing protein n=1 Tax=Methanolapillus ohkumae TaxID=3028298 RepID=A0AA96ZXH1_9EURY|nr:hypothetical protein MsAm2_08370 [Methanosarcinaceae archaeon Am2]